MTMPGRKYSQPSSSYRYGFNGQENSEEIAAGLTTAMYWEYDSRIGRRWNVDPVVKEWESPYACFSNSPIYRIDPYGNSDTTFNVAGGGSKVRFNTENSGIFETYNSTEVYSTTSSYIPVPISPGQLRSFHINEVGTFKAKWTVQDGKPIFSGYLNNDGDDVNQAIGKINARREIDNLAMRLNSMFSDPNFTAMMMIGGAQMHFESFNSGPSGGATVASEELFEATEGTIAAIETGTISATTKGSFLNGQFSITQLGWQGYPKGIPKPNGPFLLLEGEAYAVARVAANIANKKLSRNLGLNGKFVDIHEITPVKFNGSPSLGSWHTKQQN